MKARIVLPFLVFSAVLLAQKEKPRHVFSLGEPLTAARSGSARAIAEEFLRSDAAGLGLSPEDFAGVSLAKEYRTEHNGVTHLVYKQQFLGMDVVNGEWIVNVDSDGKVINAGGTLYPKPGASVAIPSRATAAAALRSALASIDPELADRFVPLPIQGGEDGVQFYRGELGDDVRGKLVWYGTRGAIRPAWQFHILTGDAIGHYSIVVDGGSKRVLSKEDKTYYQAAPAKGLVFDKGSPQPSVTPGVRPNTAPAQVERNLISFAGDPLASPNGWVDGIETAGNNTITGTNPLAFQCISGFNCPFLPQTTVSPTRDFSFPLVTGAGAPNPTNFADAATTNLFYWVNKAHDLYYASGFNEAAGNFQRSNFNKGGVEGDPVYAYSQYGSAARSAPQLNNAFFGTFDNDQDGYPGVMAIFLNTARPGKAPGFYTDNAYDAETIVHEYTHGVSHRLVRLLDQSFHGGMMGEGWSDFFALEFLTPAGAPIDGSYDFSAYPDQTFGLGIRTRPYSTNMDVNPLTFANLGHVIFRPEVHADGEIWVQALWEARANLIKQFGESEGRHRIRMLVLDGMKLSPPAPSMLNMRDAILLADQVDFKGASQNQLWAAFAKRGMGVLAQSGDGSSIHISPSFEMPSSTAQISFYEDKYVIGELVRVVLHDSDLTAPAIRIQVTSSSGDVENVTLRREQGIVYTGGIPTEYGPVLKGEGVLEMIPGDSITAYYVDANASGSAKLIEKTIGTTPEYYPSLANPDFKFGRETALNVKGAITSSIFALPFEFPYFGKKYSSVRVYSNGLLTFDLPDFSPCSDVNSLALLNAIAPMWMDLRTDGSAQANEDVYTSRPDGDSITFRWAAETVSDFQTTNPEPVNFAVTLQRDGQIQFRYGSGNRNLVSGSQLFGCPAGAATVGLSNGHETYVELSAFHDSKGTLENAPMISWEPGFSAFGGSVGVLESPAAEDKITGVIRGKGYVYEVEPSVSIARVDVLVDNQAISRASAGVKRPDACTPLKQANCVGFTFNTNPVLLGIKPGRHSMQLQVTNSRGVVTRFPEKPILLDLEAAQPKPAIAKLESPAEGAVVSGITIIKGYAYANELRVTGVDVLVDGVTAGRATLGATRTDICGGLSPAPANCPGWTFNLNTLSNSIPLRNGEHKLQVRVQDEALGFTLVPPSPITINVTNPVISVPNGVLASPKQNEHLKGTVKISGYAYVPGAKITRVRLVIDGSTYGDIPYGSARPSECAALSGVAACPNIGFEIDFDTKRVGNGPHTLGILLGDDQGLQQYIDGSIDRGINVFVEN
ncbi:MAG TPA: M36 family metallopeptidase [Bryobacteraceae bacterium]|nr:M36 family metallopeptidase [Bryobacteraceae bacterium]